MGAWKLYYDGGCNLCHVSQLRVERWARKARQPLEVDVLAGDEAVAKGYGESMVLEADGRVYTGAEAWMKVVTLSPWYLRPLAWMRLTYPTRRLATAAYNVVAKYRIKWFGSRACQISADSQRPGA